MILITPKVGLIAASSTIVSNIVVVNGFENTNNDGSTTTNLTLSGTQSGDVVYAFQMDQSSQSNPSGYSTIGVIDCLGGILLNISRKVLTGADSSITFPAGYAASADYGQTVMALVLRGVNATPEDATMTKVENQTGAQPDSPSITTTTAGALIISVFGVAFSGGPSDSTFTPPSGYTLRNDLGSGGTFPSCIGIATAIAGAAGSYNPGAWSGVTFSPSTTTWGAGTLAVRSS